VWRSITYYGVDTLVIADGHMNSERYIHVDCIRWPSVGCNCQTFY
jgi:hypothetical protein